MSRLADHLASWGHHSLYAVATTPEAGLTQALPELAELLARLEEAQRRLHASRRYGVLLIVQGLDASGKDSLLRTLNQGMDPAGFHVHSFGRPSQEESSHDFLWRIMAHLPARGHVSAFNRSHYEAVMAERLLPNASNCASFWRTRCEAITAFEQHLHANGTRVLKVWLHTSAQEQRARLLRRLDDPRKRWKFEPADIDTFHERELYLSVADEAMRQTATAESPWYVIPADQKPVARRLVAQLLTDLLEHLAPDYPPGDPVVDARYRALLLGQP